MFGVYKPVFQDKTVLVVDDTSANLRLVSEYFEGQGCRILVAQDGESALEKAELAQPDLILLDVRMPGMDGFETCRRLKANENVRDTPVIFITALIDSASTVRGFEVGGVDYITKPFRREEFLARVETHLALHAARKQLAAQNQQLQAEVAARELAETALQQTNALLEKRVAERTVELAQANASLIAENAERQQAEAKLRASHEAEREFSERLALLSEITTELSQAESLDTLCYRVIELGRDRLGFDRLALWFLSEDRGAILGTYGVDTSGGITDERKSRHPIASHSRIWPVISGQVPLQCNADAPLYLNGHAVGQGMRVTVGLWDGETVIGFLSIDNLLHQRPFADHDYEILRLYASVVARLCSLKRAQEALTRLTEELERRVAKRTAQLELANQELDAFNFSISHDLRAPLRSLSGFSQALWEDYAGQLDSNAQHYLEHIRTASQRMSDLIDDLLRLSRLTRNVMQRAQVDLSALAESIAGELRTAHPERQVEFAITPGLQGNADPNLLRIVLENLLGNAWKFTSEHPSARIEFSAKWEAGHLVYWVRDDGAGFDMAYADKLFGVFQRLHSVSEFEGTGIGLTIVQRIIHRHGGRVWAEAAVEQGATFYFTLIE